MLFFLINMDKNNEQKLQENKSYYTATMAELIIITDFTTTPKPISRKQLMS